MEEKLKGYSEMLLKWNKSINLISKTTESQIWERHILDCKQLLEFVDQDKPLLDFGSGAGLPGIILSICGVKKVYLVESDVRKCAFLRLAARISSNQTYVINERIENLGHLQEFREEKTLSDCLVVSRALAKISTLLDFYDKLGLKGGLLLLKGENFHQELEESFAVWDFEYNIEASKTNTKSAIIAIKNVRTKT
ncbi:MAG: 16S rRNA (guanine(527)-N(7))-methyltransferase RsmG [Rickettsiaceae bacterium]|nr:16S rRNA (guanine(527)-N(7))-methyltransferase RsmG [Rickettsiaceae bacterium]